MDVRRVPGDYGRARGVPDGGVSEIYHSHVDETVLLRVARLLIVLHA